MKKVVLASLLAVAGAGLLAHTGFAQAAAQAPAGAPGQIQMSQEEYAAYNNAKTQTTPAAQAAAWEAYLKAYPNSAVKADALAQLLNAYSAGQDTAKTLDAADRLLVVDPNNFYALYFETTLRGGAASSLTDPAAKQAGLDAAADNGRKGLAATKPAGMSDADWAALKAKGYPFFYSAIGAADLQKKDNAGAITAYKSELTAAPVEATKAPGSVLMDTYWLSSAYYTETPPDYLNCAYYSARAAAYAPEPFKTTFTTLGTYCYKKYHGKPDGYDAVTAVAKDNLTPPASFAASVTPAPTPADMVANLIATTPDLAALALSDKEYVIQNGRPAVAAQPATDTKPAVEGRPSDADKVFDTIKGKSVELPDVTVVAATADQVQVAVSDDAVQSKTADFTFKMKEPLKTVPAAGDKITLSGTYDSYTQTPLMINMTDGAVVEKKKPPVKKPATTTHHPVHKS
jgi:tetratricopeptide (TPR) repeat protein